MAGLSRETVLRYAHSSPEQKRKAVDIINGTGLRETLEIIFEKVRSGQLSFEDFYAEITGQISLQ